MISRYFGAGDEKNVERAVHTNILFGIAASVVVTIVGVFGAPQILMLMQVPENVLPESITYFQIYFAGSVTIVMYNMFYCKCSAGHPVCGRISLGRGWCGHCDGTVAGDERRALYPADEEE